MLALEGLVALPLRGAALEVIYLDFDGVLSVKEARAIACHGLITHIRR